MLRNAWRVARPYFVGEMKYAALGMLAVIISFELVYIYLNVLLNTWNNKFYNSLQELDLNAFTSAIKEWIVLVAMLITVFLIKTFTNMWMALHWRYWLTRNYLKRWTEHRTFYGLKITGYESDNPDQRISEDILSFVEYFLGLGIGLMSAIVSLVTFTMILWNISGDIDLEIFGVQVHVVGYMFWVALIYAFISTLIMHFIGRPLVGLLFDKEMLQANFRYGMMRLREYAESIAFYDAGKAENIGLLERFREVVVNTKKRIRMSLSLSIFINIYNNIANIMPIIIVAPRYFAKEIRLGDVMQISSAFSQVNGAVSWFIDSYVTIAAFGAVTKRLATFVDAMDQWQAEYQDGELRIAYWNVRGITWDRLKIYLPDGRQLLSAAEPFSSLQRNYKIIGPSGAGKSTFLRTVAGIWPFANGQLKVPERISFIPQNTYMPYGTLEHAIHYPQSSNVETDFVKQLLAEADLEHLIPNMDRVDEWNRVLSGGEKQKISLFRAILQRPEVLIIDEGLNALDRKSLKLMHQLLSRYLADTIIFMTSHHEDEAIQSWPVISIENGIITLE
ncbi:MAG: ABC transporter ATP-binding protein/permease [Proteobacteria bacterium]|nr:ABC transporter ATP-binding protein/permease [Pseudomonadota bacterium]